MMSATESTNLSTRKSATAKWKVILVTTIVGLAGFTNAALGQSRAHPLHNAYQTPGFVAKNQADRTDRFQGYVQPVEFSVPDNATVAIANGGGFDDWESKLRVGLNVGSIYRLRVSNIPENLGGEVYPTLEVINRLHPPEDKKDQFPIPVQITQRDLEHAMAGRFVTRVIYLENPNNAYPEVDDPNEQRTITALPSEDPLQLADQLGRPMAILRMGSRKPDTRGMNSEFLFHSPPVTILSTQTSYANNAIPAAAPLDSAPAPINPPSEPMSTTPIAPSDVSEPNRSFDPVPNSDRTPTPDIDMDSSPSDLQADGMSSIPKQDTLPKLEVRREQASVPALQTSLLNPTKKMERSKQ